MKQRLKYLGLTTKQVEESRQANGVNTLTPPPQPSWWSLLADKFRDPLIRILIFANFLSLGIAFYEIYTTHQFGYLLEPIGIFIAIVLATTIGFVVELKANNRFKELTQINDDIPVKVIRDGQHCTVPRRDIVVGDIVIIESGDEVPADGEILETRFLTIDESTLTGEPLTSKSADPEDDADATYPTNRAYRGTAVAEGNATIRITSVGDQTEAGNVFQASQIESSADTPLTIQLRRLGKMISTGSYIVAAIILLGRTLLFAKSGGEWWSFEALEYFLNSVMIAVTLIVVSVPEGLPMSINLSLALSMHRMLRNNNLVRRLHACETMGAATVICTDKTGTLTRNRMTVANIDIFDPSLRQILIDDIAVNSTADLRFDDKSSPAPMGNPTEGALLLWLYDNGIDYADLRMNASVDDVIPFSTDRKYMATLVTDSTTGSRRILVKGAPSVILSLSSSIAGGKSADEVEATLLSYQQKAMRTIAFAYADVPADAPSPFEGHRINAKSLVMIGVVAISDPVRDDVPDAISRCSQAGIDVKIVTGDASATAAEVGRLTGIVSPDDNIDEVAIDGASFAALDDETAMSIVKRLKVISRARPADKLRLVNLLQRQGEVVAVTGDGTNDAPALKAAHVGLSMGDGTSVAKEASDITIIDNSFASIVQSVKWGRSLYLNIQRFLLFQLVVNVIACLVVAFGAFTGVDSPLTVTQMLWVNLIMDTFAALALSALPPSDSVLENRPRRQSDFIINGKMWWFIGIYSAVMFVFFFLLSQYFHHSPADGPRGWGIGEFLANALSFPNEHPFTAREYSLFFSLFVFCQFWNMFNARSFGGGVGLFSRNADCQTFLSVMAVIAIGQVLIVTYAGQMFNVVPLSATDWAWIIGTTSLVAVIPQLYTAFSRRHKRTI